MFVLLALAAALMLAAPSAALAAPVVTGGPASPGNARSLAWTFDTDVPAECRLLGTDGLPLPTYDWQSCSSPAQYELAANAPDGDYTFQIRSAGSATGDPEQSSIYTLDTAPPDKPTVAPQQQSPGNSTSPSWAFSSPGASSYECRLHRPGEQSDPTWEPCSSPKSYTLAEGDGDYTFEVQAHDAAGNTSAPASDTYTLDTKAPDKPTVTPQQQSPGNSTSPSWAFSSPGASSYQCRLHRPGEMSAPDWQACDSPKSYTLAEGDGDYTFEVRALDALQNSSAAASDTYAFDGTPPAAPAITGGPPDRTSDPSETFTFTRENGATTQCRLERGDAVAFDWTTCTSPWSYGLTTEPDGTYTFRVRATDGAGNTGPAASRSFTLDRTPPQQNRPEQPQEPTGPVLRAGVCINLFNGSPRADVMNGSPFGDVLLGDAGNDKEDGGPGDDCVLGDAGNDTLFGGKGNDDVRGMAGNDKVYGGPGNDQLAGNSGNDKLVGDAGNDSFDGGSGRDTIYSRDKRAERVDCGRGRDVAVADRKDKLRGCERRKLK